MGQNGLAKTQWTGFPLSIYGPPNWTEQDYCFSDGLHNISCTDDTHWLTDWSKLEIDSSRTTPLVFCDGDDGDELHGDDGDELAGDDDDELHGDDDDDVLGGRLLRPSCCCKDKNLPQLAPNIQEWWCWYLR